MMKVKLTMAAAACLMMALSVQAAKPVKLFNGKDLKGWKMHMQDSSLNPAEEFVVKDGVICLSGKFGYIYTPKEYSDYKLVVEWRWPGEPTNSGIFIHKQAEDKIWPQNFECQLKAGQAGDIYNASGASCAASKAIGKAVVPKQQPISEKPAGEWNKAEITCQDGTITIYINGVLQNKTDDLSSTKGAIALQSEGGPIEFRSAVLTPLD